MNDYWLESVYTDGSRFFISNPTPKRLEEFSISIRVYEEAPINAIYLASKLNGHLKIARMEKQFNKNGLSYYSTYVKCFEKVFSYQFYICAEEELYYYNQKGITKHECQDTYNFKIPIDFNSPTWVKNSVFYQIFPDRFCNGNNEISVKTDEYRLEGYYTKQVQSWNSIPDKYENTHCLDFYGGDLEGIINKIPYLKKLGINAIYLNPIFSATSVHRYDCIDYFHVDKHLGGDEVFEKLVDLLHQNDIKIIIDISINHTGASHKWFNKSAEFYDIDMGAFHNPNSKERKYYFFSSEDDKRYISWNNNKNMPVLNYLSDELRKEIYLDEASVVKKWLKEPYHVDGWRFDVGDVVACNNAYNIQHKVWKEIRSSIKEVGAEKYILAEHWTDATDFLQGTEWDATMNYFGFTRPIRKMLGDFDHYHLFEKEFNETIKKANFKAKEFIEQFWEYTSKIPFVIQQNMFNMLDSHDLPRLHTIQNISKEDYISAVVVMFTIIGTPSIYYGDEIEIEGFADAIWESCRFPMPWEKADKTGKIFDIYSRLCEIKKNKVALSEGGMKIIFCRERIFSFARIAGNDVIITICSMEDAITEVDISIKQFGKKDLDVKIDLLGNVMKYVIRDGIMKVILQPHSRYLFEL